LCKVDKKSTPLKINQNIYITSDEFIEEGDFGLNLSTKNIVQYDGIKGLDSYYKKIILTTDQDLIADGVQAIDDEFLEWFVKNPSCEKVEVINNGRSGVFSDGTIGIIYNNYKIIIPKEEPKQETTLEEHYLAIPNPLVDVSRMKVDNHPDINNKETLEEVSPMNDLLKDLRETKISAKESIDTIEDEFMRTQINIFVQKTLDSVIDRIENKLLEIESKWQQEQDKNKFSEEDMKQAFLDGMFYSSGDTVDNAIKEWFEQFSKLKL
jgi:hypothetical protein